MYLEIVTPEAMLFSAEVDAVTVPGVLGEFQMLNNHAPIVSLLGEGKVKIQIHSSQDIADYDLGNKMVRDPENAKVFHLDIQSGTVEMKQNKVVLLID